MGAFSISELGSEWEWNGVFVTKSGVVVGFYVPFESATCSGGVIASFIWTLERSFTCMCPYMPFETTTCGECPFTPFKWTLKRLLSSVGSHMFFKTITLIRRISTPLIRALEPLLSTVHLHMPRQRTLQTARERTPLHRALQHTHAPNHMPQWIHHHHLLLLLFLLLRQRLHQVITLFITHQLAVIHVRRHCLHTPQRSPHLCCLEPLLSSDTTLTSRPESTTRSLRADAGTPCLLACTPSRVAGSSLGCPG